jgi:C1A family cysteine protease
MTRLEKFKNGKIIRLIEWFLTTKNVKKRKFSTLTIIHVFKALYNKTFRMEFREDRRRKAFEENLEKIRMHNEAYKNGTYSFKLSPNDLADLTNNQYLRHYVRLVKSEFDEVNDQDYVLANEFENKEYPPTLDWREKGFITPPSNQKSCGSCYGTLNRIVIMFFNAVN